MSGAGDELHYQDTWDARGFVLGSHFGSNLRLKALVARAQCRLLFSLMVFSITVSHHGKAWVGPGTGGVGPDHPWASSSSSPLAKSGSMASLSDAKPKPVSRTIPHGRQECSTKSPEIVLEEAKKKVAEIEAALAALASVGATEGPEVQFLKESLQKRASQEPPIAVQVSQTEAFVERARKRLAAHDAEREALVNELEASQSRLARLRALAEVAQNVPSPQPVSEVDSEIAALRAKLASMEEERDVRGRRPKRQAVAQADAGFIPGHRCPHAGFRRSWTVGCTIATWSCAKPWSSATI